MLNNLIKMCVVFFFSADPGVIRSTLTKSIEYRLVALIGIREQ